jgi:predicted GIY-YIG superfamily endonuclease
VNGATIGGPCSGTVTDIFGAEYIDKVIMEVCPYPIHEYRRYRDDTIEIAINSTIDEQKNITEWLNENVYKDRIKFTGDYDNKSVVFLDVKLNLSDGYLKTEMYSKPTDIHQYLHPESSHPSHVMKGIPKSVGVRIRRNCSTRYDNDEKFIESLREFKGYLITSGYEGEEVDQAFGKLAHVKREDLLKEKEPANNPQRKSQQFRKHRFITNYEPAFTDIKRVLLKHQHILKKSQILRKVFPRGARDFQVPMRREAKNLKELLAPSKVNLINNGEEENPGSRPCGKGCTTCEVLQATESTTFKSTSTKLTYRIRQQITCESKNVVYLVGCKRHNMFQGVGYNSTEVKKRVANYKNHHKSKTRSCGISQHFQDSEHDFKNDFVYQPIVKIHNVPENKDQLKSRLEEFELYWQENLITYEPYGMNKLSEMEKARGKLKKKKKK